MKGGLFHSETKRWTMNYWFYIVYAYRSTVRKYVFLLHPDCTYLTRTKRFSMLGSVYFLKIAKTYSQREKPMCSSHKNQFPRNRKNPQSAKISCHTVHSPSLFCIDHQSSLSSIYNTSSNSLMRPVGLGGVRDGNAGLAGLLLPFIRCQLSVLVNFSFSYNTVFLSSVGYTRHQILTHFGNHTLVRLVFNRVKRQNLWTDPFRKRSKFNLS